MDLPFPARLISPYWGTNMNRKTIAKTGTLVLLFTGIIWLAANLFMPAGFGVPSTASEKEIVTEYTPPPEKVSFAEMHKATTVATEPEVKLINSELNEKLYTLRKEKLNAEIAQFVAKKLKANNHGGNRQATRTTGGNPSLSPNSANLNSVTGNYSSSAFTNASLTYFDYGQKKAFIRVHDAEFSAFTGMVIDDMTVSAFKENGLLISRNNTHRLLTAPKTYSIPNSLAPTKVADR